MTELIVYDFDGTIYNGDSFVDFWKFIIRKQPVALCFLPLQLIMLALFFVNILSAKRLKESFLLFFSLLPTKKQTHLITTFWNHHQSKINSWIYSHKKDTPDRPFVCISASPEFLLRPIIDKLGFDLLIGSIFKEDRGRILNEMISNNCKGVEKINRLNATFDGDYTILKFYSDHTDDTPLFNISNTSFLVKNGVIEPLPSSFLSNDMS